MTRTKKSKRGRKRNVSSTKSKSKASKPSTPSSPESATSPFKGYAENVAPNLQDEENEDLFDRLIDNSDHRRDLYKNIRTYSNKNKVKQLPNNGLLEFNDCKNRDEILRWLNNTQNVFGRLTQTQDVPVCSNSDEVLALDLPSVSQQATPKVNRSVRERKLKRSPYKLRAKSLNIQVTKNVRRGRNKRHSLAGETPDLEHYEIEEAVSDEEVPIPAENGAIIIDLMEDEYLDNLDREMLQKTGWERIRDVNKTINKGKRQPKKLNIVQVSPEKKPITLLNNNHPSYDYDILENYFIENMERLMEEEKEASNESEVTSRHPNGMFSVKNALQVGKNLLTILRKIQENGGQERLEECEDLFNELKPFANLCQQTCDKNVQTEPSTATAAVQTNNNAIHTGVQTDETQNPQVFDKGIQAASDLASVEVQTEDTGSLLVSDKTIQVEPSLAGVEVQTEDTGTPLVSDKTVQVGPSLASVEAQTENALLLRHISSVTSATVSDLLMVDEEERRDICEAFDADFDYDTPTQKLPQEENDALDDDAVFALNTEEFFKNEKTQESVLVVSEAVQSESKGVKRPTLESPEVHSSKRPCDRFIRDDLSVDVLSCVENEGERKTQRTRTQEQIEELESMIYNATRTKPEEVCTKQVDDSDYFRVCATDEKSPKKIRRSLFNAKNSPYTCSESVFIGDGNATLTKDNVDEIMEEDDDFDKEVREILENERTKINILQDVTLKNTSDEDMEADFVEMTPQKETDFSRFNSRKEPALDVTLPPPPEFQDSRVEPSSPPRRPLAVINKVTSTPVHQKFDSEKISLSPITPKGAQENTPRRPSSERKKKALGPIELVQQSKYTPLTVVKKLSQNVRLVSTPVPKQKSILNYVTPSQEQKKSESFDKSLKPCIACSRISREQVMAISSMTNRKLATYSTSFTPKVTHLIVSVNEKNCLKDHTIKYVAAVASGRWVLNFGWVKDCLAKNTLVPEEPYEVLDVSGLPGPQQSRLTRTTDPLFKGLKIYAASPFVSTTKKEIENVVSSLGGQVAPKLESLYDKNGYVCLIVTEARATQDFVVYETWLEALGVVTVDIEWLSRSVGQYQLLSLRPFALCPDDNIEELGYPPELTANMTYSMTQQSYSTVPSKP